MLTANFNKSKNGGLKAILKANTGNGQGTVINKEDVRRVTQLPSLEVADTTVFYYISGENVIYQASADRKSWITIGGGVAADEDTLTTVDGLMAVKQVPIGLVTGLDAQFQAIDGRMDGLEERVSDLETRLEWQPY